MYSLLCAFREKCAQSNYALAVPGHIDPVRKYRRQRVGSRGRFISGYQNAILEAAFRVFFGIPPLHWQLNKSLPTSYRSSPFWVIWWVVHGYPLGADSGCGWHDRIVI